jgi:hypothetical protein
MTRWGWTVLRTISLGLVLADIASAQAFKLQCSTLFEGERRDIDKFCPPEGSGPSAAVRQENLVKNNFCASGPPITVTLQDFSKLQEAVQAAGVPFGSSANPPLVRGGLRSFEGPLGEGTLVKMVAFVSSTHYADVATGESANCKLPGAATNDIHISLGETLGALPCSTIIAEISPHLRPQEWTPERLSLTTPFPVRITGQMFFDTAHRPCGTMGRDMLRLSTWEIHPVYRIDVCRATRVESCSADDDSEWVPLRAWSPSHSDDQVLGAGVVHEKSAKTLDGSQFNGEVAIWVGYVNPKRPYPVLIFLTSGHIKLPSGTVRIPEEMLRYALPKDHVLLDATVDTGGVSGFFEYHGQAYKITGNTTPQDDFTFRILRPTQPQ